PRALGHPRRAHVHGQRPCSRDADPAFRRILACAFSHTPARPPSHIHITRWRRTRPRHRAAPVHASCTGDEMRTPPYPLFHASPVPDQPNLPPHPDPPPPVPEDPDDVPDTPPTEPEPVP